nr:kanadaptin isoform X2 [Halyomorpha halys]
MEVESVITSSIEKEVNCAKNETNYEKEVSCESEAKNGSNDDKEVSCESEAMNGTINDNEVSIESESKDETKGVFKKPVFIGPRKGAKGSTKKSTNKNLGSDEPVNFFEGPSAVELKPEPISNFPSLPYSEPNWKGLPNDDYFLEELKSGVIQRRMNLRKKSFVVFGRIDSCDVVMAHPTVSRYHAVLQYRGVPDGDLDKGFYLYDLDSTHGTFLNKGRLKPKIYARIKVGHMIKFGCSTRFFLLQGPEYDEEEESDLTLTELKEKRKLELEEKARQEEEELRLKIEEEEREKQLIEERGVSWGLGDDADVEEDLSENPYAVTTNEELYIDDPKKSLRHWFEREGEELQFMTEQAEKGMIACKIVLPLDDGSGKEMVVESSARSKKEAQFQCALEACRLIDKLGLFRQSKQEAKRHQKRNWEENDYYDSDEDSFFDRTGDLDLKRQKRMKKAGKIQETVETYESLMTKHKDVIERLKESQQKLEKLLDLSQHQTECESEDQDALDTFMKTLKHDKPAKLDIKIARDEVAKLKKEEDHLRKLINIVKPTSLPELKPFKVDPVPIKEKSSHSEQKIEKIEAKEVEVIKADVHIKEDDPVEIKKKKSYWSDDT